MSYNPSAFSNSFTNWLHVPSSIVPTIYGEYSLGNTSNVWANLYIESINVPVGSVITSSLIIAPVINNANIAQVVSYSTNSSSIPIGTYGNNEEITAPWTVYQLVTPPNPPLQVNDLIGGAAIPLGSYLSFVGIGANNNIIIANTTITNIPPESNTVITVVRDVINPSLSLVTIANTNIALTPGNNGIIIVDSDIVPLTTSTSRLGTPAKRYKELWLGPGTLYVADETLGDDLAIGAKDGNFYIKGGAGLQVGQLKFVNNTIQSTTSNVDIQIGLTSETANFVLNRNTILSSGKTLTFSDNTTQNTAYIPNIRTPRIISGIANTVTIDFSTDTTIHLHTNAGTVTANLINFTAGKQVDVIIYNNIGGTQQYNHGLSTGNRAVGGSSFFLCSHPTMWVTYICEDNTETNCFVKASV